MFLAAVHVQKYCALAGEARRFCIRILFRFTRHQSSSIFVKGPRNVVAFNMFCQVLFLGRTLGRANTYSIFDVKREYVFVQEVQHPVSRHVHLHMIICRLMIEHISLFYIIGVYWYCTITMCESSGETEMHERWKPEGSPLVSIAG